MQSYIYYCIWGASWGGLSEKLLEASPVSEGSNVRQLQDRSTTGQGQANQLW